MTLKHFIKATAVTLTAALTLSGITAAGADKL